jgi:hypothetical protein
MWWSGRSANDYYSIIAGAVSKLPANTVEARQELYNHARTTLARQLEQEPRRIERERRSLEKAIRQVETDEGLMAKMPSEPSILRPTPPSLHTAQNATAQTNTIVMINNIVSKSSIP